MGLVSNPEQHVFHPRCLIKYLQATSSTECVLSGEQIQIAEPIAHERIGDIEERGGSLLQSLNA